VNSIGSSRDQIEHALKCHGAGKLGEAESAYREILAADPNQADALHYLGVIGLQTQRFDVAAEYIGKAVKLQPDNADAIINLGTAQQALGQLDDAVESFQHALTLQPGSAVVLANIGNALRQQGRHPEAIGQFKRALDIDPALTEARRNLADSLLDDGATAEALRQIRKAASYDSNSISIWASLAKILHANGCYDSAIAAYERVLAAQPDFPPVLCSLGSVLQDSGRPREAIENLEKATGLDPNYAEGHYQLGVVWQQQGKKRRAAAAFDAAISADPYCTKALRARASLKRCRQGSTILRGITEAMDLPGLNSEQRLNLEFAAGKCYEDLGEFDNAISHLHTANRLQRDRIEYDVADDLAIFTNIKRHFDRTFFSRCRDIGVRDATPIFVLGMPRAGTSLVEQILASHSAVHGGGELPYFAEAIQSRIPLRAGVDCTQSLNSASPDDLGEIANFYLSRLRELDATAAHVTDKLPNNFLHIGLIRALLPDARIVHCMRDSRDTCWSIYKNFFGGRGHYYAYEQAELGKYYCAYEDLMAHWRDILPGAIHDVRYEELVGDQESTTRTLLGACGLSWDPACLDFHKTSRSVRTLSASQVRRPVYDRSIGNWKNVANSLEPLLAALNCSDRSSK